MVSYQKACHLFDLALISVAPALLCAAIMAVIAELLGRKPRWRLDICILGHPID
jgi:hypothetical protein